MQSMQDFFAKTMGISLLTLFNSKWLTDPSYDTNFCRHIITSKHGFETCENCHRVLEEEVMQGRKPIISTCHAGLSIFVVPIIVDGKYLGCVTGGHVLTAPPNEDDFGRLAKKFGIKDKKYFEEVEKLKIFSVEKFESIADLLIVLLNLLFSVNYANFQLARLGLDYRIPQNAAFGDWFVSKYQKKQKAISDRETEVLKLVVMGKTNPEIAQELFISTHTVKAHISSILEKYQVDDRVQLAVKAVREGLA